jgi:isocitrate/isopropylmalate dehydrogenase
MHPSHQTSFSLLQNYTQELLKELAAYDHEILQKKSEKGGWSVNQVLHHLMTAEGLSLGYVKKKMKADTELPEAGISSKFRMQLLRYYLNGRKKHKAPTPVSSPPNDLTFPVLREKWESQREELNQYLDDFPDHLVQKAIYKHPVAGRIGLKQMLEFFLLHVKHHHAQIHRILSEK